MIREIRAHLENYTGQIMSFGLRGIRRRSSVCAWLYDDLEELESGWILLSGSNSQKGLIHDRRRRIYT